MSREAAHTAIINILTNRVAPYDPWVTDAADDILDALEALEQPPLAPHKFVPVIGDDRCACRLLPSNSIHLYRESPTEPP